MLKKVKIKSVVCWSMVVLWMGLIFYFSAQPASESSELSSGVTEIVARAFGVFVPEAIIGFDTLHLLVRKGAHFFVYFVLGILVVNAFNVSGFSQAKSIYLSFAICVIYAISDEVHQLFVPGRSGEVTDVIIDSIGAGFGIGCFLGIGKLLDRYRRKRLNRSSDL
ncbi:VanZ family protein [Proteinivorax hydrogeniformans]|uniref:VanZ family protein n=1 Tax=Proteinivorax hydrogeniformans TaxID=1826727 RepID=A0AAU8HX26_9FIRM